MISAYRRFCDQIDRADRNANNRPYELLDGIRRVLDDERHNIVEKLVVCQQVLLEAQKRKQKDFNARLSDIPVLLLSPHDLIPEPENWDAPLALFLAEHFGCVYSSLAPKDVEPTGYNIWCFGRMGQIYTCQTIFLYLHATIYEFCSTHVSLLGGNRDELCEELVKKLISAFEQAVSRETDEQMAAEDQVYRYYEMRVKGP